MALQEQVTRPLQTLANVVAALREEDYSFRARGAAADDALGELSIEVNGLADLLADRRISAIEATALLRRVVEEVEVPLFAFDRDQTLRLVNSAGEKLLQMPSVRLLGRTAAEIGLAQLPLRPARGVNSDAIEPYCALVGPPQHLSAERPAAHPGGLVRRKPCPEGRRAFRLAAPDPCSRP